MERVEKNSGRVFRARSTRRANPTLARRVYEGMLVGNRCWKSSGDAYRGDPCCIKTAERHIRIQASSDCQREKGGEEMKIGILAFGSLIDDPGDELSDAITGDPILVETPFPVEKLGIDSQILTVYAK